MSFIKINKINKINYILSLSLNILIMDNFTTIIVDTSVFHHKIISRKSITDITLIKEPTIEYEGGIIAFPVCIRHGGESKTIIHLSKKYYEEYLLVFFKECKEGYIEINPKRNIFTDIKYKYITKYTNNN